MTCDPYAILKDWTWNPVKWVKALFARITKTEEVAQLRTRIAQLKTDNVDLTNDLADAQEQLRVQITRVKQHQQALEVCRNVTLNALGED